MQQVLTVLFSMVCPVLRVRYTAVSEAGDTFILMELRKDEDGQKMPSMEYRLSCIVCVIPGVLPSFLAFRYSAPARGNGT